ncbi:hypothetical protein HELRODRAFT_179145 [Helobdella robusta]|uniref:Uncharacterized protein n=1 Tax=Helobdella robusta TaxID=6412 RepID=T1FE88_HELRO|nr:hypothetical protein HELRODRAFT_179145 [Helobdella robusta]ESN95674.1 hypothetical protein HELRODRAFT_179145 [Helobdella robusta]
MAEPPLIRQNKFWICSNANFVWSFNPFGDKGLCQAVLPICMGGLGLGVVADLAPSAFLSFATATATLQNMMLPVAKLYEDHLRKETFAEWCSIFGDVLNIDNCSQRKWNEPFLNKSKIFLEKMNDSLLNKARLMAVKSDLGSVWLRAVPSTACGTRLDNASIRVDLCLRLGLPVVSEYRCLCGAYVFSLGYHGLSCKFGSGGQARHSAMNDYLIRLFQKAYIPAIKQPASLILDRNIRPEGYTLTPWSDGRCLTWDVTFPHTLADRYISNTLLKPDFKNSKYVDLNDGTRLFVPVCVETFGPIDKVTQHFFDNISTKIIKVSGDPNDKMYMKQNVSLLL